MNNTEERVVSVGEWMLTIFLMCLPLVNLIMLLVWAFGGGAAPSKSNWAKATLIWMLIGIVFYVVIFILILGGVMAAGAAAQ